MMILTPDLCRLCLTKCSDTDKDVRAVQEIYRSLFGYTVLPQDIPQKVCPSCEQRLLQLVEFQEQCTTTESLLTEYRFQSLPDTTMVKEEIPDTTEDFPCIIEKDEPQPANEEQGIYTCSFCNIQKEDLRHMRTHVQRTHAERKWFQCPICPKTFFNMDRLRQHCTTTRKHCKHLPPLTILSCDICNYQCAFQDNMEAHYESHTEAKLTRCECGKMFACPDLQLQHHILTYSHADSVRAAFTKYLNAQSKCTDPKSKRICEVCGATVSHRNWAYHQKICSGRDHANPRYICDICNNSYKVKNDLTLHIKRNHLKIMAYQCCYCDRQFSNWNSRRFHMTKHDQSLLNHVCDVCGKRFAGKFMLLDHQTIHSNIRAHQCDLCDKAFKRAKMLKEHKDTVHQETRTIGCEICGKAFKNKKGLRQHAQTHRDRAYKCPMCPQAFTVGHTLRGHVSANHPEFPMPPLGTNLKNVDLSVLIPKLE